MEVLELKEQEKSLDFRVGDLLDEPGDTARGESFRGDRELDLIFSWALDEVRQKTPALTYEPSDWLFVTQDKSSSPPSIPENVKSLFEELADTWEMKTELSSRTSKAVLHPAYQQIIGIGPVVVPLLLARLRDNPSHWFWALAAITREDPAHGMDTLEAAREAWLTWGRRRGFVD